MKLLLTSSGITNPSIAKAFMEALHFVDFYVLPHLDLPYFSKVNEENIKKLKKEIKYPMYALDDHSALKVVDGKVEIVSGGDYLKL